MNRRRNGRVKTGETLDYSAEPGCFSPREIMNHATREQRCNITQKSGEKLFLPGAERRREQEALARPCSGASELTFLRRTSGLSSRVLE